ncbi:hypothetical protein PLEOSDRAFT_165659 [Pleurotus ostreatus PC15]|uniref:Uncharacterized protein n=1 Tax=Pleurotus ostreatus (strain PC15) TaxID=1137138 RepID=A0A067NPH6_PLEO1|nr:hypothetical protein PLEOSDRAFT_165659 [Pleurotus ostreatus PC15]
MSPKNDHLTYADQHIDLDHIHLTEADISGDICVDEYYLELETPPQFSRSHYVWMLAQDPVNVVWAMIVVPPVLTGIVLCTNPDALALDDKKEVRLQFGADARPTQYWESAQIGAQVQYFEPAMHLRSRPQSQKSEILQGPKVSKHVVSERLSIPGPLNLMAHAC